MYFLYNSLLIVSIILISPYLIFKLITNKRYRTGLKERLTGPRISSIKNPLWIHAASVGEVKIASLIIKEIKKRKHEQDIVLSVFTDTGMFTAKDMLKDIHIFFLPLDLPCILKKTIRIINPKIFVIIESELWPNLLYLMNKNHIPCILVNGRISDRSYKNYKKIRFFSYWIIKNITVYNMRTEKDRDRIIDLGADTSNVSVTGNLKYEDVLKNAGACDPSVERRRLFITEENKVIIFGCMRNGEEEELVTLFGDLIRQNKNIVIIVAPRHIDRVAELERLFRKNNLKVIKKSMIVSDMYARDTNIILIDSLGGLFPLYSICNLAFVGGSLKPFGGHNVLEPAVFAKPVLFGKFTQNFEEEAKELISAGGGIQIKSSSHLKVIINELFECNKKCIKMGKLARSVIDKNHKLSKANIETIARIIHK